jgi:hypothetical protein
MNRFRSLNPDQVGRIIRTFFQMGGAALGMFGYMTDAQWLALTGPLGSFLILLWGVWAGSDPQLLASAADVPGVKAVIMNDEETANSVPNAKVASVQQFNNFA